MLQALLADRFKLTLRRETKEVPVYALVMAKDGSKLQEAKPGDTYLNGIKGPGGRPLGFGMTVVQLGGVEDHIAGRGVSLESLVKQLSGQLGRTVLDKTGLTGKYDFILRWKPDEGQNPMPKETQDGAHEADSTPSLESSGPSIFTELQDQLGLELKSQEGPVEILVVDHVEKPTVDESEVSTPVRVPIEVMSELILKKVPPNYPEMARKAHLQGAVVLDATIGKGGDVENLQIISGHPMLAPAAIKAVKQWRYKPYLLNGEPVEVKTQVEVNFTLSE
jgi:uncharacterized protein (TIGR03435 family)